jgi:hypothetical protein
VANIELDIDRKRIKTILEESYNICKDILTVDFLISREQFVSRADPYLKSNRVSTIVSLGLPSKKYPELKIELNVRHKKVIARMANRDRRIEVNRYLTKL